VPLENEAHSRTGAVVHSDGLGLLPIHFYITFDDFLTVGKCRLAWRCRDDIGVVFERWLDIGQRIAADQQALAIAVITGTDSCS
jgi:hypothetical protein